MIGGSATVIGSLPALLTGVLAPQVSAALSFGVAGLGAAFAVQSGVGALTSVPLGRLVDRLGATRSIRLAMITTAIVSLGIAAVARSFVVLVLLLAVGACAKRMIEPAANRLLINNVGDHRLGLAFGLKQSAPPAAVMLAGSSVPLAAMTWGWPSAYVVAGAMALLVVAAVQRRRSVVNPASAESSASSRVPTAGDPEPESSRRRSTLIVLSVAFGLANGASVTVPVFYVSAAVAAGATPTAAGAVLAAASIVALVVRLALGVVTDRLTGGHLRLCAVMLGAGAGGFSLLATGRTTLVTAGVVLALAGAWGFSGVFWFTLVRSNPAAPGRITGRIAPGALVANSASPLVFGLIAGNYTYALGWVFAGLMAGLAAIGMLVGERRGDLGGATG